MSHHYVTDGGIVDLPPHSADAEKYVLGSLMLDLQAFDLIDGLVEEPDFYIPMHARLFRLLQERRAKRLPLELPAMVEALEACTWWDKSGNSRLFLLGMLEAVSTPMTADFYARTIAEKARRRKLIYAGKQLAEAALNPTFSLDELQSFVDPRLFEIPGQPERFKLLSAAELFQHDARIEYYINGILAKNQNCVLAAPRKGMKTSLTIELLLSLATGWPFLKKFLVRETARVAMLSCESGYATLRDIAIRVCAGTAGRCRAWRGSSSAIRCRSYLTRPMWPHWRG